MPLLHKYTRVKPKTGDISKKVKILSFTHSRASKLLSFSLSLKYMHTTKTTHTHTLMSFVYSPLALPVQ